MVVMWKSPASLEQHLVLQLALVAPRSVGLRPRTLPPQATACPSRVTAHSRVPSVTACSGPAGTWWCEAWRVLLTPCPSHGKQSPRPVRPPPFLQPPPCLQPPPSLQPPFPACSPFPSCSPLPSCSPFPACSPPSLPAALSLPAAPPRLQPPLRRLQPPPRCAAQVPGLGLRSPPVPPRPRCLAAPGAAGARSRRSIPGGGRQRRLLLRGSGPGRGAGPGSAGLRQRRPRPGPRPRRRGPARGSAPARGSRAVHKSGRGRLGGQRHDAGAAPAPAAGPPGPPRPVPAGLGASPPR